MTAPVDLIVGLDYELFFGERSGSVERCLIQPCDALLEITRQRALVLVFFVDAGMLDRMAMLGRKQNAVRRQHDAVRRHLDALIAAGHELQLHIHPHWEDTEFEDGEWKFRHERYRLHAFGKDEQAELVARYSAAIAMIGGAPNTYRAGGWCLQPFHEIAGSLHAVGVRFESSVIPGAKSEDAVRYHDFAGAPGERFWQFESDPLREEPGGRFIEVPITPVSVNAAFYWRYLFARKLAGRMHRAFGDGNSVSAGTGAYLRKLLSAGGVMEASIDGYKSTRLRTALTQAQKRGNCLNIMGHPKALTPFSLQAFEDFLDGFNWQSRGFRDGWIKQELEQANG